MNHEAYKSWTVITISENTIFQLGLQHQEFQREVFPGCTEIQQMLELGRKTKKKKQCGAYERSIQGCLP